MTKTKKIHLWIPELFSTKGGIQVFSGFFLQAIQQLYPQASLNIFVKNDPTAILKKNIHQDCDRATPVKFHGTGLTRSPFRTILFASILIIAAITQKPDLVIMTHLNFAPIALLLKKVIGIKYVAIAHGVEAWNIQNPMLTKSLQHADLILAVSSYTRDRLYQEQSLSAEQVGILHNTFDADHWQIVPKPQHLLTKYKLEPDQKIILTVSRLVASEQYKGYDRLLEAMPTIRQVIPNVHYLIVGKGSDTDRINQIILQNGLRDCVTLAGFVPDEELCDYYNLCDLFAMPSKREGFGIVYLEALACGKPVLAGNLDGAIDALCHGRIGVLVNPDDTEAIGQAIIDILLENNENKIIYQPQMLREESINNFGFIKFQKNIFSHLLKFLD